MSLSENGGGLSAADVAAVMGGSNNGFGWGGDGAWWLIVLFLFAFAGNGWGGNNFGGGNMGGIGTLPYFFNNTDNAVQRGFDTAAITGQLSGIQASITNGFGSAEVAACNRAMDAMQTSYANQIASMNQNFANQQALDSRLYAMQTQQANCCCENRLGIANLTSTILAENCADRAAVSDGVRDILANQTASVQRILDQMCQDKIDAKNEKIAELQNQLSMAQLAASQTAQTAQIRAGQVAEIDAMYQRLRDCPVPTMPVYGMQPIFTCPTSNSGCGCGCSGNGSF